MKKYALFALIVFYLFAGLNHFINPETYMNLFPKYLQKRATELNYLAGFAEITLAVLMFFENTRKFAAIGIILMLIAFIPSHIYFIQEGNLSIEGFTISPFIAWIRLLFVHPLLILWAWWLRK